MCIGSCIGGCCATCATSMFDRCGRSGSFIPYIVLLFLTSMVALILYYWGADLTLHLYAFDVAACPSNLCASYGTVYRLSFALFVFFALHFLVLLVGGTRCAKIDYSSWLWKIILFLVLIVLCWIIPDNFYMNGYVHVARIGGAIFLLLQIVLLIDFAYSWNESWTSDDRPNYYKILVMLASVVFIILSVLLAVFGFVYLASSGSDCRLGQFFIGFTITLTTLMIILSISNVVDKGGLLPATIVTGYCYWLCFTALSSSPSSCNTLASTNNFQLVTGILLGAASIAYSAYELATNSNLFGGPSEEDEKKIAEKIDSKDVEMGSSKDESENGAVAAESASSSIKADGEDEEALIKMKSRSIRFHSLMLFAAMYMAMLLTNWGSLQTLNGQSSGYDISNETMWVKIGAEWVTIGLYTWTLVASKMCPNRDFS